MLQKLAAFASLLSYPLYASLLLTACGAMVWAAGWRRTGRGVVVLALAWSFVWSIPAASDWLRGTLEARYPVVDESELPQADAIVVLGGATWYGWTRRDVVDPWELSSSRLAAGARAWLLHRAPIVILSGGRGGKGGSEAARMSQAIRRLGVPDRAIVLETQSRNTEDNAVNSAKLIRAHGGNRILLMTSAIHMPRALELFQRTGLEVVPVPVPERAARDSWSKRWLPSPSALWRSGRALKEYVALFALALGHERVSTQS
ncbi:YdcF family protein [Lysobacter terrae]